MTAPCAAFADDGSARLYQTREEQREAGQAHALTPWLGATLLGEFEPARERRFASSQTDLSMDRTATLQLGLTATPVEDAKGEVLLEYDTEEDEVTVDEAVLSVERGDRELSGGRMYLPFGVFFSHFASGGLVEFGETRATAVSISQTFAAGHDLEVAFYRGGAREVGHDDPWDAAFSLELWPDGDLAFGIGAISDLADADAVELPTGRYARRVAGWTGYARAVAGRFQVTAEALGAATGFRELEADRNRPAAWNVEAVCFCRADAEWALRLEGSRELADAPALQGGTAVTWRPRDRIGVTVEYLRGRFSQNMSEADGGGFHQHVTRVGGLVSVAF